MKKVGIIGYGTIGEDVAQAVHQGRAGLVQLEAILVRDKSKYEDSNSTEYLITEDEDEFFNQNLDIVIECAGHGAVRKYGERALHHGADLILVSIGAFADESLQKLLRDKAEQSGRKIIVPSAAIGGLDRIAAGSVGPMEEVTLVTRKPPKAWYGTLIEEQVNLAELSEPYCAFEGVARDSARLFPESVNVSAALSLAGIGFDKTKVKVYVDPHISHNIHEIEARGKFGQIKLQIQNTPSARNPKTGYIVAMSVIKTLRDMSSSFVIGI
ncbi:aspartate dehydrogenase [Paenibacillus radicis (ex Xue et al. 2023)]|uniref:L-aspartate dehydrogenase n=1 Tax=Paenibacillus radicis (ex Xue et al. 2023) TaxID=2972489 RepID=A0ABT1YTE2_9BACL|nr:aspartate dehydrogenase [Paenibacillus radicis (ex Xue et al. 2023)]MCR8635609.1 aspartate dehydrogenase [Paenibacillus radicis (ex Xue et al. 2023)]